MLKKYLPFFVIATLVFVSLACSITVNAPRVNPGPIEIVNLNEPYPEGNDVSRLSIEMGAGKLNIKGGASNLVEGEIRYNVREWKPTVTQISNGLTIRQSNLEDIKITSEDIINDWDLKLGQSPIDLTISAGAYKGTLDLSSVPLTNLSVSDGASQATVQFNSPNPVEMERFRYRTGASQVTLEGLSNTGAEFLLFEGGAGSYTLDFSGTLHRDMNVNITTGVSSLKIIIPEGVHTRIAISGGLSNVQPRGTWNISNNIYETTGSGPLIDINLNMGLGNLELITK